MRPIVRPRWCRRRYVFIVMRSVFPLCKAKMSNIDDNGACLTTRILRLPVFDFDGTVFCIRKYYACIQFLNVLRTTTCTSLQLYFDIIYSYSIHIVYIIYIKWGVGKSRICKLKRADTFCKNGKFRSVLSKQSLETAPLGICTKLFNSS